MNDVRTVLLTHWHNDHSSGAEAIRQLSGAAVYYHGSEHAYFAKTAVGGMRRKIADLLPERGPAAAVKALLGQSPPHAIAVAHNVSDGQVVASRFRVIGTPGHSAGHVSYLYEPQRVLFTGDALAVCGGRLWFMSRFLTEDRDQARESMLRCVEADAAFICPGHRGPLMHDVNSHREALREHLNRGAGWPLLS